MSGAVTDSILTHPYPNASHPVNIEHSPPLSSAASTASSSSESEPTTFSSRPQSRRTRIERPKLGERQRSSSIIVPKGTETLQKVKPVYPPHDARAMSPRRSSHDVERLEQNARKSLQDQARVLQSSLQALAERIDEVKNDHDKLESENRFLQDYIGGLTRTMSGTGLGRSGSTAKKSKK